MKHFALIACLVLLAACSASEPRIDPRYLYRASQPVHSPSVQNARDVRQESGRIYNERGERVEAFMPGSTDPDMPGDMNNLNDPPASAADE